MSAAGISKVRDLFEHALTAVGLHVSEANKIWEGHREFEQAILDTIDETDIELTVPHADMRSILLASKAWEMEHGIIVDAGCGDQDDISSQIASAYQKAVELYNMPAVERLQHFMNYLKFGQSLGDPACVQVLYERVIAEFPIATQLWIDYTCYLDKTLKNYMQCLFQGYKELPLR